METDKNEHLKWCKSRALEYVDNGDNQQAMSSMISDLRKHEDFEATARACFPLGLIALQSGSSHEMRKFIEGFN